MADVKLTRLTACLFPETALVVPSELKVLLFKVLEISQGQDGRAPIKLLFFCNVKGKETRLTSFSSC